MVVNGIYIQEMLLTKGFYQMRTYSIIVIKDSDFVKDVAVM